MRVVLANALTRVWSFGSGREVIFRKGIEHRVSGSEWDEIQDEVGTDAHGRPARAFQLVSSVDDDPEPEEKTIEPPPDEGAGNAAPAAIATAGAEPAADEPQAPEGVMTLAGGGMRGPE